MALSTGTKIGAYEITGVLGAGGMGEVYRARDTRLDRDVAIKVLPASVSADPERRARFEREAKAVAALSHPNILAIHEFGVHEGLAFAVMELLEGETLRERLKTGALPVRKATEIAIQIARGLGAAHDKSLIHRDLKPENLFLLADGQVKILDFGLARTMPTGSDSGATETVAAMTDPGIGDGHGRLHGARAGARAGGGRARRSVRVRRRALRNGVRPARVPARHRGRHDDGRPQGRSAGAGRHALGPVACARSHHPALPRKEPRRAFSDRARRGIRARVALGIRHEQ